MIPIAIALLINSNVPAADSISDLSKALFEVAKRSAIVVVPTYDQVSVASDPKLVEDLVDPLRKQGFASLTSDVAVIYQNGIPQSHLGILKGLVAPKTPAKSAFKEVSIPQSAIKGNLITFETKPGEAIKVNTLMNLDLPRRIMVSPYYTFDNGSDFPLAMMAKDMPSSDFAKALARGLSGKLVTDPKFYNIAFDANNFRTNVSKLLVLAQKGVDAGLTPSGANVQFSGGSYSDYQEFQDTAQPAQSNSKPSLTAGLTLLGQAIAQMNDQLVEQTFAYKGTSTRLNLATFTGLQNAAISYLRSSTPATQQAGTTSQRVQPGRPTNNLAALVNRVDPRNPGKVVISTEFRVSLELNLMQGRPNRNGPPQTVDAANTITIQVL
ncbi:MAG: hypothetical protein WCI55_04655 [Armatimonadota bacterium]